MPFVLNLGWYKQCVVHTLYMIHCSIYPVSFDHLFQFRSKENCQFFIQEMNLFSNGQLPNVCANFLAKDIQDFCFIGESVLSSILLLFVYFESYTSIGHFFKSWNWVTWWDNDFCQSTTVIVLYWILQASSIVNSFYTLYAQEVWDSVHMQDEYRVFIVELIFW